MKDGSDPKYPPAGPDRLAPLPQSDESWLKVLVEQSPLGISIARDGITLYANQACARLFGYDGPAQIVGTSQLGRVAPESRAQVTEYIRRRKQGEPVPSAYEITGLRRNGSTFPLYVEVTRIDWDEGPVSMAYFTDCTDRKCLEEALQGANTELEIRVAQRTEELSRLNEQLLYELQHRRQTEADLKERESELEERSARLADLNVTLRTILEQRDQDRRILEQRVTANFNELIKPLLDKLRKARTESQRVSCLDIIESNLEEIVSPFTRQLTGEPARLTATEIQIANGIRQGMRSKEIAALLKLSKGTVDFHRNNIRRKLKINDRKTTLRSHLDSLIDKI
jgi:PAS domain S-box-containing protein